MACSETRVAAPAGQPLLSEALAWLEARVTQRVVCSDHGPVVAEVLTGRVLDPDGHHRRSPKAQWRSALTAGGCRYPCRCVVVITQRMKLLR